MRWEESEHMGEATGFNWLQTAVADLFKKIKCGF